MFALLKLLRYLIGEVQASPTSNTLLDRLKTIATKLTAPTAIVGGQNGDVDLAAEVLASTQACDGVMVQAHPDNTGVIYVGGSTAQYVALEAGDSVPIGIDDIAKIYVKASVVNQKVNYWYVA